MNQSENIFTPGKLKFLFETKDDGDSFFKILADVLPSIIYIYDAANKKLNYINAKVTQILGYDDKDIAGWDYDFMKFVFADDVALVMQELEKYSELKDDESHQYGCRFNHKAGNSKSFSITGSILRRNEEGKAALLLFVAEDISDIEEARLKAKADKQLMDDTEELLEFGAWSWDAKSGTTEMTDGMYKLLEYDKEDKDNSKNHFRLHISPTDQDIIAEKVRKAIQEKSEFKHTCRLITMRKKKKIVLTKGKIIFDSDGQLHKILGITHNITSLPESTYELLLTKELINEQERFSGYGSWEFDFQENEITWSDGMYYMFGYDPDTDRERLVINEDFYYAHMPENERETGRKKQQDILSGSNNYYVYEYEIIGADKRRKIIETHGKIIRDDTNKPVKCIGTTRDVTTLRQFEQELKRKIIELDRSNKDLEEFAYLASHDLQEPLRKISTFGERLHSKYSSQLGEEGNTYLLRMRSATESMSLLIDNLLELSLLSHKTQPYKQCDLGVILQEVQTELELVIEETKTTILTQNLPLLEAVPSQMNQLFSNLISNAIKFRKPELQPLIKIAGKKLSGKEINDYHLPVGAAFYQITIEDNGIGFEAEYATKIFQIFQRLHGKAEYSGSGIGLAICKKIIDNHHGQILAGGIPGEGAVFKVLLPEKNIYTI